MNFFNTLLFLSEIGSKIGNVEIDKKYSIDLKELKRLNKISFVNHLPDFDKDKNHILVRGKRVMVGTILKRPLNILPKKLEYHYGVVLGTSILGKEILIEMTKRSDVSIVTKQEFLVDRFKEEEIEIESLPPKDMTREQIIERAKEFQFDIYHLLDLNCKIFAKYIVWDIATPQRTLELKKFQMQLCDITISMLKLQLSEPKNAKHRDFLSKRIIKSENDKNRLSLAIGHKPLQNSPA